VSWVEHQCRVIRAVDPRTPICMSHGGDGLRTADPMFWRKTSLDFYTYHLYPGATVPDQTDYGLAVDVLAKYGNMCGRCFLGESSGDEWSAGAPEAMRRRVARDIIWFSLVESNPGCFFWNARGYEVEEFKLARQIAEGCGLADGSADRWPSLAVAHPLADDKWYRSAAGVQAIRDVSRQVDKALSAGQPLDFAWLLPPVGRLQPVDPQPSAGFQAVTLRRGDVPAALTYLRNVSGTEVWTTEDRNRSRQLVRTVAPAPCRLTAPWPAATAQATDLVTGATVERIVGAADRLDLGLNDHDWAIVWRM